MKYLIMVLTFLFSLNSYSNGYKGIAAIGTITTNPAAGTTIVSTGALSSGCASGSGNYIIQVFLSSTATPLSGTGTMFDFQSIFSGSIVSHIYIGVPSTGSFNFTTPVDFAIPDQITLQVQNIASVTGNVQANIFYALDTCN